MRITAPITACELETGISGILNSPIDTSVSRKVVDEKTNNTSECDTTTTSAATGVRGMRLSPTVIITFLE